MAIEKHYSEQEILAQVSASFAPLTCDPVWSRDHDRLGFVIRDLKARRGVRFPLMKVDMLETRTQLALVLDDIRAQLVTKGFQLSDARGVGL